MRNGTEVKKVGINSRGGNVYATCCTECGAEAPCCGCYHTSPCAQCGEDYPDVGTQCPHCGASTAVYATWESGVRDAVAVAKEMKKPVPAVDLDYPIVGLSEKEDYLYGNRLRGWRSDHCGIRLDNRDVAKKFFDQLVTALVEEGILS